MDIQNIRHFSDSREIRAKAILQKGEPSRIDEYTYLVPSQTSDKKYKVSHIDSYSCECEDFKRRCKDNGLYCKHIKAIILFEKLKNSYEMEESPIKHEVEQIIDKPQQEICPFCNSSKLIKRGIRQTQIGEVQRYSCKDCKKRFVLKPIPKIKGNAKLVCLAMDCYYKGLSYRDISDQFKQFYGLNISHEAIRAWVLRFGEVMEKYSKTLSPNADDIWNADETMIRTKKGNRKKGADYEYVWNVLGNKTKFLLASITSGHGRGEDDARKVMEDAWQQSKEMPEQIITDRLPAYQGGVRKTFRNWGNERKVKHISIVGKRKQINNNAVENQNGQQKEFHKVRRGVNEVQKYQDGFKVFHNFIRKGVQDKLTPAERCGIEVKGNRWETMLLNSIKSRNLTANQKMLKSP